MRELDLDARRALVTPFTGDWYTQPKRETNTEIERLLDRRETLGVTLSFGEVSVTDTVLAYQRKRLPDHEVLDLNGLDLPQTSFTTQALWYELGSDVLADDFPLEALLGALHATEHAQIAVLPLIAMCDRWDIGGLSTNLHPQTGGPTIFIYDGHPGGIGIARTAFARFEELCGDAHRLIAECPCASGCPSCVQSPKCGNLNEPLSKAGARLLLERMLAAGDLGAPGELPTGEPLRTANAAVEVIAMPSLPKKAALAALAVCVALAPRRAAAGAAQRRRSSTPKAPPGAAR